MVCARVYPALLIILVHVFCVISVPFNSNVGLGAETEESSLEELRKIAHYWKEKGRRLYEYGKRLSSDGSEDMNPQGFLEDLKSKIPKQSKQLQSAAQLLKNADKMLWMSQDARSEVKNTIVIDLKDYKEKKRAKKPGEQDNSKWSGILLLKKIRNIFKKKPLNEKDERKESDIEELFTDKLPQETSRKRRDTDGDWSDSEIGEEDTAATEETSDKEAPSESKDELPTEDNLGMENEEVPASTEAPKPTTIHPTEVKQTKTSVPKDLGMEKEEVPASTEAPKPTTIHPTEVKQTKTSVPKEESSTESSCNSVTTPVPAHVVKSHDVDVKFYKKYIAAYGVPILSSLAVKDEALKRACYVVKFLLADRADIRKSFIKGQGRAGIIGVKEFTTNIPEHSELNDPTLDSTTRGLGGTLNNPISTAGEENLRCLEEDRYPNEDIFLHEFSHGIMLIGISDAIPDFNDKLVEMHKNAKKHKRWYKTYAWTHYQEYFAEGVQSYFGVNDEAIPANGIHNHVNTRAELKEHDPDLYSLIEEIWPCGNVIKDRCDTSTKMPKMNMDCKAKKPKEKTTKKSGDKN